LRFSEERLALLLDGIERSRTLVVGDLMLDRYVWGSVERISPEAPVPVVSLKGESANLGGAANVAANVASLGGKVALVGVVGDDSEGTFLTDLVRKSGFAAEGVVRDPSRPTSVKTRVIAQNQHVVRIDRELTGAIPHSVEEQLVDYLAAALPDANAVILEDYNKGVLTSHLIERIIKECRALKVPVGVDPKKENFWAYRGATLFKPNLREFEVGVGRSLRTNDELAIAGRQFLTDMDLSYLLVTRGEQGMALFYGDKVEFIPTRAHSVHDVSGAGDTVIATMMAALAGGASIQEAAVMANNAASIVIAQIGAVPVDAAELRRVCLGR